MQTWEQAAAALAGSVWEFAAPEGTPLRPRPHAESPPFDRELARQRALVARIEDDGADAPGKIVPWPERAVELGKRAA